MTRRRGPASRLALVPFLGILAAAGPAAAAPALDARLAAAEVRYGAAHTVTGALRDGATPLAGQPVALEVRRYPYRGPYRVLERAQTDAAGAFRFRVVLARNARLRVTAARQAVSGPVLHAYTFPAFTLSFRPLRAGVVRIYQRYTVPKAVELREPTLFYLGPKRAARSSKVLTRATRRVRAGRFSSIATVRLPRAWHGSFRYGSCFRTTPGSGMGDPAATCPRRLRF